MTHNELADLDASEALVLLRQGDLSALEYVDALLPRMQSHAGLHAMTHVNPDAVRKAARRADATSAQDRDRFMGCRWW